jgi:hypothetical protein
MSARDASAHVLDPREIEGNPHGGDCTGTLCPECGCCMHCATDGACGCDGCTDSLCRCPSEWPS